MFIVIALIIVTILAIVSIARMVADVIYTDRDNLYVKDSNKENSENE